MQVNKLSFSVVHKKRGNKKIMKDKKVTSEQTATKFGLHSIIHDD
jgi:hypothetical protein